MPKLTLKKIAENTLRKVGRPLSTREIWEEANRLGTVGDFKSEGKTPWATIGAYLYWSINRDKEGVFTLEGERPRRFGLTSFELNKKQDNSYYLIGTFYENSIYSQLVDKGVVAMGFCWNHNLEYLYQRAPSKIIKELRAKGFESKEYSAAKKFLQLKPGDIIALKSKGQPKGRKPFLEIIAFAAVVERNGVIYKHDPEGLGQCIHVEFIETDIKQNKGLGGYGRTIHQITDPDHIERIFGDYQASNELVVREKIKQRRRQRSRKAAARRRQGTESRRGSKPYVAKLHHNKIQEAFYYRLKEQYPGDKVTMEEDFVDIRRENKKELILYEVKPYAWAEDCIREALGQLLCYANYLQTSKTIKLQVVGPYKANEEEMTLLEFIQESLNLEIGYQGFTT